MSPAPTRRRPVPWFPGGLPAFLPLFLTGLLAGCSYMKPVAEPAVPTVFEVGLTRLADGDFSGAELAFRDAASRCQSGVQGRRALLLLSFLALDPRNPAAHPDSAALMAERFLNLPNRTLEEALQAEVLYVTALDYGADPELRIDPVDPGFAVRFGDCDAPFPQRTVRPLPTLEGSTSGRLKLLDAERDSLIQQNQQLRYTVRQLRLTSDSVQARVDSLQAELGRIRQLIQLPDTSFVIRKPDTAEVRLPTDPNLPWPLDPASLRTPGPGPHRLPFGP
jgi:hypothetical protein